MVFFFLYFTGLNFTYLSAQTTAVETDVVATSNIFSRAWQGGFVSFTVMLILLFFSVVTWALAVYKWYQLRKIQGVSEKFVKSFWDSRSLNELNSKLNDFEYSPARELFRMGYSELVKGSQLKEQTSNLEIAISASIDNLNRSLGKAKSIERKKLEKFLSFLAISASACPFIGLFGTVWGIMSAFEGIARTGSTSLASVAPGISEALTSTALGLAAAIPAVVGYNLSSGKLRNILSSLENFGSDFMNIVERYLVTDKPSTRSQHL